MNEKQKYKLVRKLGKGFLSQLYHLTTLDNVNGV